MKVEVAVPGSPSLIVVMVSVDVKQHSTNERNGVTGCVSMQGARLWLCKFSGVVVNHAFSPDYFHGCIADKSGRRVQPVVHGSSLFRVSEAMAMTIGPTLVFELYASQEKRASCVHEKRCGVHSAGWLKWERGTRK